MTENKGGRGEAGILPLGKRTRFCRSHAIQNSTVRIDLDYLDCFIKRMDRQALGTILQISQNLHLRPVSPLQRVSKSTSLARSSEVLMCHLQFFVVVPARHQVACDIYVVRGCLPGAEKPGIWRFCVRIWDR